MFWAAWAEKHDPDQLERELAWLSARGVRYVRALSMVGSQPFWSGREIDPTWSDYWEVLARVTERVARHGLRVEWVVFADTDAMMPAQRDREAHADRFVAFANQHLDAILHLEAANEFWVNGLELDELRALTRRLNDQTEIPVAATAPARP